MQTKNGVKFYKTPDAVLQAQLASWDKVIAKKGREPAVQEGVDSMRAFAERADEVGQTRLLGRKMAYNHYFGKQAKKA
jgi:TRAP-type mannitol/chloroaromatic compound transport system substrate-binding protein